jgi:PAS domain S-box-containing protein
MQVPSNIVTPHQDQVAELNQMIQRYKAYLSQSYAGIYCLEFDVPLSVHQPADAIFSHLRQHGYIAECNKAMAAMYGITDADEMVGMRVSQMVDFSDPNNLLFFRAFIENGFKIEDAESHEFDSHGQSIYFLNNAVGIVEDGFLRQVWGTQRDVTLSRETEKKLRLLADMVEETSDVLTAADLEFRPLTWSKTAEKLFGVAAKDVIGRPMQDFIQVFYNSGTRADVRREVFESGEWKGELYFIRPTDQKLITLLGSFKLVRDEQQKPLYIISSSTDITDRKQAELRLKESESRFRELADSASVMIWTSDENGICTYVNSRWIHFTGTDTLFTDSSAWESLVHPEDVKASLAIVQENEPARKPYEIVYRLRTAGGAYRWVKDICVPRFVDQRFIGYIGSVTDIDDQKRIEQHLRFQATVLENISDVVTTTDLDFRIIITNKAGEAAYGYSNEQLRGCRLTEFVQFNFLNSSLEACVDSLREKGFWEGEVAFEKKDGSVVYFLHSVKELVDETNKKIGYLSIGKDITERRKMEEELQRSELFYRTLIADGTNVTLLLDAKGDITFASPGVTSLLGYEPGDLIGRNGFGFVNANDFAWAQDSFFREVKENPEVKSITIRIRKKSGEWLWCTVRGHNMLASPQIKSVVVYIHDDSVRKQANDALKQSEKRFRTLINELALGLFMASSDGTIVLCNPMLSQMLSIPEEQIIGHKVEDFLYFQMTDENERVIPAQELPLRQLFSSTIKDFVVKVSHPVTGIKSWVMINSKPVTDDAGQITHIICMLKDVTTHKEMEKKRLQDNIRHQRQLTQATIDGQEKERTEIGKELHDNIGQQLTTIKLFMDMLKSQVSEESGDLIHMSLKGITDVINEVRAMSRALVPHTLKDLGLVESVEELVDSLRRAQSLDIDFSYEGSVDKEIPENQKLTLFRIIQEQLNNICKHAEAQTANIQLQLKGKQIHLKISDDGKGFDTKKVRRGLGLTNITNRAELFCGKVTIISEVGYGTLMSVSMPLATTHI